VACACAARWPSGAPTFSLVAFLTSLIGDARPCPCSARTNTRPRRARTGAARHGRATIRLATAPQGREPCVKLHMKLWVRSYHAGTTVPRVSSCQLTAASGLKCFAVASPGRSNQITSSMACRGMKPWAVHQLLNKAQNAVNHTQSVP
jgi:hypothetical protein